MTLTAKQVINKRKLAAQLSKDELEGLPKKEVYKLIQGCLKGLSRLTKPQLIEKILDWTHDLRVVSKKAVSDLLKETMIEVRSSDSDAERVLDMVHRDYTEDSQEAAKLLASIIIKRAETYANENNTTGAGVYKGYTLKIKKKLSDWKENDSSKRLWCLDVLDTLENTIKEKRQKASSVYTSENKKAFIKKLKDVYENVLHKAKMTLNDYLDPTVEKKPSWHRVSFALAVTSGRRQNEIHGENKSYEVGTGILSIKYDDHYEVATYGFGNTLAFTGISKGREGRGEMVFQIPCLYDPAKWIQIWKSLPAARLNCDEQGLKRIRDAMYDTLKPELLNLGLSGKYKDSRDVYTMAVQSPLFFDEDKFIEVNKTSHGHEVKGEKLFDLYKSACLCHYIKFTASDHYA